MLENASPEVLAVLLDAQENQKVAKVYTLEGDRPMTSKVLGFDYYESSLLVDGFSPPVRKSGLKTMAERPFWVQLPFEAQYLNLFCLIDDCQFDLFTLRIIKYEISDNQRWFSRIHFDPRRGPEISFEIPHELPIKGNIRNLSVHGALVDFYGIDFREKFFGVRKCQCKIQFNELFHMNLSCHIKNIDFLRKPSCHTEIRTLFVDHSEISYIQLENFVEAFSEGINITSPPNKLRTSEAHFA